MADPLVLPAPAPPRCGDAGHAAMLRRATALSEALKADPSSGYGVHGLFGIFAAGDRIEHGAWTSNITWLKNSKKYVDYQGVKTRFLYSRLCALHEARGAVAAPLATICEVGFNAGLSALLLLEAAPTARVVSFDLGDQPWSRAAAATLRSWYPSRFLGVTFGDAATTIPAYRRQHPSFVCDAAFVDGSKSYEGRHKNLNDLRSMSRRDAPVFLDEVTSRACVNGSLPTSEHAARCQRLNPPYYASVRAYDNACRHGKLRVVQCDWPKGRFEDRDGFCAARFAGSMPTVAGGVAGKATLADWFAPADKDL